jgi:hypothetical protein
MKKTILAMMGVMLMGVGGYVAAAGLSFGQVVDGVDGVKHTKAAAKANWANFKGQEVSWSGTVTDVDGKGSKYRVFVADHSRPLYGDYNIRCFTSEAEKAEKMKRGQHVRFKGTLYSYHPKEPGAVIDLKDVQFY